MIGSQVAISSSEMFENRGSDHVLFGSSMAAGDPDREVYMPIKLVPFILKQEAFKRNMRHQLAQLGFEYYNVSSSSYLHGNRCKRVLHR